MREININEFEYKDIDLLKTWALISANDKNNFNTMTISWGSFGSLWNTHVISVYIRPQRYTKEFIDKSDYFTVSIFDSKYRDDLTFLGRNSGRDIDKLSHTSLTPIVNDYVTFKEAKITFICKKVFKEQFTKEAILDKDILNNNYSNDDLSYMYIGKIEKILIND